jgi:hypothetical protein
MSLEDRDYMRSGFERGGKKSLRPSIYKRVLFFFWTLLRRVAGKQRSL